MHSILITSQSSCQGPVKLDGIDKNAIFMPFPLSFSSCYDMINAEAIDTYWNISPNEATSR